MQLEIRIECAVCGAGLKGEMGEDNCVEVTPCARCLERDSFQLEIQRRKLIEARQRLLAFAQIPKEIEVVSRHLALLVATAQELKDMEIPNA